MLTAQKRPRSDESAKKEKVPAKEKRAGETIFRRLLRLAQKKKKHPEAKVPDAEKQRTAGKPPKTPQKGLIPIIRKVIAAAKKAAQDRFSPKRRKPEEKKATSTKAVVRLKAPGEQRTTGANEEALRPKTASPEATKAPVRQKGPEATKEVVRPKGPEASKAALWEKKPPEAPEEEKAIPDRSCAKIKAGSKRSAQPAGSKNRRVPPAEV